MSENETRYFFLPWLRRGLAAAIRKEATGSRTTLDVKLKVAKQQEAQWPKKQIMLYGPGDILGFDPRIVARAEPRPNTGDFEPNYFPFIEFAEPDFPWRFSLAANASGDAPDLKPWIVLIVLRSDELQGEGRHAVTQVPWIRVKTASLPALDAAGRWAHVQITGCETEFTNIDMNQHLASLLEHEPERVVARLLCARKLQAGQQYTAFVVPAFKLGVNAALPDQVAAGELAGTPAWSKSDGEITLPYYYKWTFGTGKRGDFEHLVRRLEPRQLSSLGLRDVDCQSPGYNLKGPEKLGFESALRSVDTQYIECGKDFQSELSILLNLADGSSSPEEMNKGEEIEEEETEQEETEQEDPNPKVVPPLYGQWYNAKSKPWFKQLNFDPRHRWVAGLGAQVVQKEQEALMASAWDQLGDIEAVNEVLRRAQFGIEVSTKAEVRLSQLSTGDYLRATAPLLEKTPEEKQIHNSPIRKAPLDAAFRRIVRNRGPLRKHQQKTSVVEDMLVRLNPKSANKPSIKIISKSLPARGVPTLDRVVVKDTSKNKFRITSVPSQQQSRDKFSYDVTFENPNGGGVKVLLTDKEGAEWLKEDKYPQQPGRLTISVNLKPPTIAKTALASKVKTYHFTLQLINSANKEATQSFDVNVYAKKSLSTKALAHGDSQAPIVYAAAANVSGQSSSSDTKEDSDNNLDIRAMAESAIARGNNDPTASAVEPALEDGWLKSFTQPPENNANVLEIDDIGESIKAQLSPVVTITQRSNERFQLFVSSDKNPSHVELIKAAPEFPQPMWSALAELSQEFLLAGIEKVPQNTVALMATNPRFVEAFLCGLNHEFSRELLWREYPTDQRGTYFRQFWDKGGSEESLKDIAPISRWGNQLGENMQRTGNADSLVLLLRGDLLNKYPNTAISLVQLTEVVNGESEINKSVPPLFAIKKSLPPLFAVSAKPDMTFMGFDITPDEAIDHDWYFVLEERLSETRFGLDEGGIGLTMDEKRENPLSDISWGHFAVSDDGYIDAKDPSASDRLVAQWQYSSAEVASITLQKPVRVIISAKRMIPPVGSVIGRIATQNGDAISGAMVAVGGKSAKTDVNGRFKLEQLPLGAQIVTATHPDYVKHDEQVILKIAKSKNISLILKRLPGSIGGRVMDHRGRGLVGARVFYKGGLETRSREPDGDYDLTDVPVGHYLVTAEHEGYQSQNSPINVESRMRATLSFSLIPTTGTVAGRVIDHQGKIISGVQIVLGGSTVLSGATDGRFEMRNIPIGSQTISVQRSGFQPWSQTVSVQGGEITSVSISLLPTTGTISGNVRNNQGAALSGASVMAGGQKAKTDSSGYYVLSGVPVGNTLTVTALQSGYKTENIPNVGLKGGESKNLDFTLLLLPGSIEGKVTSMQFVSTSQSLIKVPIKDAKVTLGTQSVFTDATGTYRFINVESGNYDMTVSKPGYITDSTKVTISGGGQLQTQNFMLLSSMRPFGPSNPRPGGGTYVR